MRDHTKLRAFQLSDELVLAVYRLTALLPKHEQFGLTMQIRRAALSIASNIVEGCARTTEKDYLRFLDMAYASGRELEYQLSLAPRLDLVSQKEVEAVAKLCTETCKVIAGLIKSLRR